MTSRATGRNFDLGDYIEVKDRIAAFVERYPDGSLQSEIYLLNDDVVVMKAYAYRTADDARPGVGWSSLQIPGSTPYTRGSEIENCETSAWGRAIAALGFNVNKGVASQDELVNKRQQTNQEMRRFGTDRPVAGQAFGSAARNAPRPSVNRPESPPSGLSEAPEGFANVGQLMNWAYNEHGMGREQFCEVLHVDNPSYVKDFEAARLVIIAAVLGAPPEAVEVELP